MSNDILEIRAGIAFNKSNIVKLVSCEKKKMELDTPSFTREGEGGSQRLLDFVAKNFQDKLGSKTLAKKVIVLGGVSVDGSVTRNPSVFVNGQCVSECRPVPNPQDHFDTNG